VKSNCIISAAVEIKRTKSYEIHTHVVVE